MTISFDAIPIDIRTTGQFIEYSNRQAVRGVVGIPSHILLLAQKLPAGTAAALTPIDVSDAAEAEGLGGRGSQLHRMVRALRKANNWTRLTVVTFADLVAGAQATGGILFGGDPVAPGTLNLYIGGQRVRAAVSAENTPAQVATAAVAAINAATDLPVTAAVNGTTAQRVDITARHKGECGNDIDLRLNYYDGEFLPLGLTASITAMSGGTGNPDIAPALAAMGDVWYSDLILPWIDAANLAALLTEIDDRWGPLRQQDCFAWTAKRGTFAQMSTFGNGKNDKLLQVLGSGKSPSNPDELAAIFGGVCAFELKNSPARPLQTVVLTGMLPPAPTDQLTQTHRNLLLYDGISTFKVADGVCRIDRVITTYQTNAFAIDDPSYLDTTLLRSLAVARYHFRARIAQTYPRARLAPDEAVVRASDVATPRSIKGTLVAAYGDLIGDGVCADMDRFKAETLVEIAADDRNRVNAKLVATFVGGLIVFAAQIEFRL